MVQVCGNKTWHGCQTKCLALLGEENVIVVSVKIKVLCINEKKKHESCLLSEENWLKSLLGLIDVLGCDSQGGLSGYFVKRGKAEGT